MKILFLGTGTSYGVPVIGCDCNVCRSSNPRNRRRRTSLLVETGGFYLVFDTPPDFREQMLEYRPPRIDAVCLTHSHADHVSGFDDVRIFSYRQAMRIPVFASPETIGNMKKQFYYVFGDIQTESSVPKVEFREVAGPFAAGPLRITPFTVSHGYYPAEGFRLDSDGRAAAYIPDCKTIPEPVFPLLEGLDLMILDATTLKPHPTHLCLAESLDLLRRIGARRSFITHISHSMDHAELESSLPDGIEIAYDGLTLEI